MIQVFKPCIGEAEIEAVVGVLRSGWIGLGPRTAEFEKRFADYADAAWAVAVNSGTAALHLALLALDIGPGDEVLVPALTFVSTAHAVSYCGARSVFVDIEADTLNIDMADAERRITKQTRAIIPVHYGGTPCRMDDIWQVARERGLVVIEDAAHACGAVYHGHRVGGLNSDATCFSFHAVKNLTTGDGGMVTTDNPILADTIRRLRWCGIDKDTWQRSEKLERYAWFYEVRDLGYKCHMNDIAAALGLVQLSRLEEMNQRRRQIAAMYDAGFEDLEWLTRPVVGEGLVSARHNYVIQVPHRDRLNVHLRGRGIASGVHYIPLHLQPCYRDEQITLPTVEAIWPKLLTLPMYPDLSNDDAQTVIEAVRECEP
jgi:perosamine synthetase